MARDPFTDGAKLAGKFFLGMTKLGASAGKELINSINVKRTGKLLADANELNKGIIHYNPCPLSLFFNANEPVDNTVVSGGTNELRCQSVVSIIDNSYKQNLPVIVLHESNRHLENQVDSMFKNSRNLSIINDRNPVYEPFWGLKDFEISKLIIDSAPKDFDIRHNAKYYLEGMAAFLRAKGIEPYCSMFIKCPHQKLFDIIDNMISDGRMDDNTAQKIKSMLMMGQSENYKIESYFLSLKDQIYGILNRKGDLAYSDSILKAINNPGIILIDITSNTNTLVINLIVNQIKIAMSRGKGMTLITESLSAENNEVLGNLLKMKSDKCKTVVSTRDLYSMCCGDEKMFHTIIGNSSKIVIHSHSSAASAAKWSEVIGYYDKQEASQSSSAGKTYSHGYSLFPGYNSNNTINYSLKRDYIVKPEEITRMQYGETYIYDSTKKELSHTIAVI